MELLYGKPIADEILKHLKKAISKYEEKPGLAVILVGDDEASKIYVNLKEKAAKEIGVEFYKYILTEHDSEEDIEALIEMLNDDEEIHGMIVQLPLPAKFDTQKIISMINPQKDVDGFHPENAKKFIQGQSLLWPVFPLAIIRLIEESGEKLKGRKAIVIANSDDFGKIMQTALEQKDIESEYILAKDVSSNLEKIKTSDIVVSAVGSPGLLRDGMFKEGVIVIDGGIEKVGERVVGDVDFASIEGNIGFITPVPGGVGPVTIACLLGNVYLAFEAQQK
jgi:methylenetetrahydrofolate dehydrogenase (NADP+)/methenyltetrahydrofolate cyclohydrolase